MGTCLQAKKLVREGLKGELPRPRLSPASPTGLLSRAYTKQTDSEMARTCGAPAWRKAVGGAACCSCSETIGALRGRREQARPSVHGPSTRASHYLTRSGEPLSSRPSLLSRSVSQLLSLRRPSKQHPVSMSKRRVSKGRSPDRRTHRGRRRTNQRPAVRGYGGPCRR